MLLWCSTAGFLYSKHNDVEKDKTIILCKEVIHRRTMLFIQLANPYIHGESSCGNFFFLNGSVKKPNHKQNPNLYFRIQWSSILQERRCHLGEIIPNITRKSIYFKGNFRVNASYWVYAKRKDFLWIPSEMSDTVCSIKN